MTDELLPPDRTLASAALDNEVTADERAQVEASPTLRAERDVYADVQASLREVDVPAAARDSAMAAALAAFDTPTAADDADAPAASEAVVVPLAARRERRDRMRGWLTGVAAAAVIGVVGVAVVNSGGQDDDKSASTDPRVATMATTAAATEAADDSAEKSSAFDSSAGGASDTTIVTLDQTAGDAPAAAPVDGRPVFDSPEQVADFYGATPTADTAAAAETANSTASTAAADTTVAASAAPAGTDAATQIAAACIADPTLGDVAAVYRGEPVILRLRTDGDGRVVDVIAEATCVVVETIPLG